MKEALVVIAVSASQVGQAHCSFLMELRGLINEAHEICKTRHFSIAIDSFQRGAERAVINQLRANEIFVRQVAQELSERSRASVIRDLDISETSIDSLLERRGLLKASLSNLFTLLEHQVRKDVITAERSLTAFRFKLNHLTASENFKRHSAVIKSQQLTGVEFSYVDRLNRQWQSDTYAELTTRQALLDIYNESYISTALSANVSDFALRGTDGTKTPFDLTDYPEVRKKSIHPRSNRLVEVVNKSLVT